MLVVIWILLLLLLLPAVLCALKVLLAKSSAIRGHKYEVSLFFGLVKLILWEANQGLVFLKNKRVSKLIYGPEDGGGTMFIYPIFGEELRVRVPLTLKLTQFEDDKVLTRESTQLFMKVAFWWRVADLQKYYYSIDKQVHIVNDRFRKDEILEALPANAKVPQQDAAETWMLTIAESCIRKLVSQATTALVVSKTATSYLHVDEKHQVSAQGKVNNIKAQQTPGGSSSRAAKPPNVATPESLAGEILSMLGPEVAQYGLEIDRVEIQEVRLPKEIQAALDDVFKATLLPAQSQQEALAQKIKLQSVASVLGVEAVALTEVLKSFKGSQFIGGMPKFIEALFAKTTERAAEQRASDEVEGHTRGALPNWTAQEKPGEESLAKCPKCRGDVSIYKGEERATCPSCGSTFRLTRRKPV
jgi:regulator of protease activity HflC (stomatin/prohibitin superfamily)